MDFKVIAVAVAILLVVVLLLKRGSCCGKKSSPAEKEGKDGCGCGHKH